MTEILHELGTIARALDSISNVKLKQRSNKYANKGFMWSYVRDGHCLGSKIIQKTTAH